MGSGDSCSLIYLYVSSSDAARAFQVSKSRGRDLLDERVASIKSVYFAVQMGIVSRVQARLDARCGGKSGKTWFLA